MAVVCGEMRHCLLLISKGKFFETDMKISLNSVMLLNRI